MKKSLLILSLFVIMICTLTITASADSLVPEWTDVQNTLSIPFKDGFDTTSRVLLSNGNGTYATYPTNYVIVGSDTKFSVSTELDFKALNDATENKYSYSYASVVRLEIPSGFITFEERALRSDKGFTSMLTCKIPEGATTFGSYMFWKNNVILEVELPNSLETLGAECFRESQSLKKVSIGSGTEVTSWAFYNNTALETVILPEGIEMIGERAFQGTSALKSITLPSTLTRIDAIAFYGSGLTEITVPEKVTSIGAKAFESCASLSKAIIKCDVIGERMFCSDKALETIAITGKISSIGKEAFASANSKLVTLYTGSIPSKLGELYNSDIFTKADTVTYQQYLMDVEKGVTYTKATIVYSANPCAVLNNNVHVYDNPTSCVAVCTDCSQAKEPSISDHKLTVEYTYDKGFAATGEKITKCTVDGCKYRVSDTAEKIFSYLGYSCKIGGSAMSVSYSINNKAYSEYVDAGYTLKCGIVAYVPGANETNIAPVNNDLKGKNERTVITPMDNSYTAFDFLIKGFNESHNGLSLVMCAYVFDGETVEYLSYMNDKLVQTEYAQLVTYKYEE